MARRTALRASDLDREQIAERLRNATAEGRLVAEELEERLGATFSARTDGELDAIVADLPAVRDARARSARPLWVRAGFAAAIAIAVLATVALVTLAVLGIAGAWLAWMLLAWMLFGRGRRFGRGRCSRFPGGAVRSARAGARTPRGRTASL